MLLKIIGGQKLVSDDGQTILYFHIYEGHLKNTVKKYGWPSFSVNEEILKYVDRYGYKLAIIDGDVQDRYYLARFIGRNAIRDFMWASKDRGSWEILGSKVLYEIPFTEDMFTTIRNEAETKAVLDFLRRHS